MIKEHKIKPEVVGRLPQLVSKLESLDNINALYLHGSYATGNVKPLSDIDFAVLFISGLSSKEYFNEFLKVSSIISRVLKTEEYDLINMNTYPPRFSHNVLRSSKLLFYKNKLQLINFIERNNQLNLDFKYYRTLFDMQFLDSLGIVNG